MAEEERRVTIDGKIYRLSDLGENGEAQLNNLRGCELELTELQRKSAIAQTARAAYARQLQEILKTVTPVGDAAQGAETATTLPGQTGSLTN